MTNSNYKFQFNFSGNTNPSYYLYLNNYNYFRELYINRKHFFMIHSNKENYEILI